jgi:hypothetical protein
VLGYHGCDKAFGMDAVNGLKRFLPSKQKYDWLGSGTYFWEYDSDRAQEWAIEKKKRGHYKEPFVIGAVIDLGNCLDLTVRENVDLVKAAYRSFAAGQKSAGMEMPVNKSPPDDKARDDVLRYLDCAVMNHLHAIITAKSVSSSFPPFDTVRAIFGEGVPIYDGSGFREKTHVQIAVRNLDCIKGVFLPPKPKR